MIDNKSIRERQQIRINILKQLYNLYYSGSENNLFATKTSDLYEKRNDETHLAYHYLLTAGYIEINIIDDISSIMITPKGIDFVEALYDEPLSAKDKGQSGNHPKTGLIHHIELYVADLKKSMDFWGWFLEKLGYEPFQAWEGGHSWRLGHGYIVFVQTEERFLDIPYHRCRVGLNHLAFHAESREQVDEMAALLKKKGFPILYANRHPYAGGPDHYAVYFEDPDRIKVELVAPS